MDDLAWALQLDFEQMKNVDVDNICRDSLVDIRDVVVNPALPPRERLANYIRQIKNPYLFKCGKMTVQVEFADTNESLEDRLKACFLSLSQ